MLTSREMIFLKLQPVVTKIVTRVISDSYPNYYSRNEEDVKSNISLFILQYLDLNPDIYICDIESGKLLGTVIDFVLNRLELSIKKDIIYESNAFSNNFFEFSLSIEKLLIAIDINTNLRQLISYKLFDKNDHEKTEEVNNKSIDEKFEEIDKILKELMGGDSYYYDD